MPKRKNKYTFLQEPKAPYITFLVQTSVLRPRAKFSTVRFAFAPDGELLAASMPLDPNVRVHAALIAKARERVLRPRSR